MADAPALVWLRRSSPPWTAPAAALDEASVRLGRDYPAPIVDHDFARRRALAAFEATRR